jgi:hypothetical protein
VSRRGHHGRGLPIETGNGAADRPTIIGIEFHDHPDRESGELGEAPRRAHKLEAFDDPSVQLDQIILR